MCDSHGKLELQEMLEEAHKAGGRGVVLLIYPPKDQDDHWHGMAWAPEPSGRVMHCGYASPRKEEVERWMADFARTGAPDGGWLHQEQEKGPDVTKYSFCETTASYLWHIRPLSDAGRKLGGGADTETLCGLMPSWDVNCEITPKALEVKGPIGVGKPCPRCAQAYNDHSERKT